MSLFFLLAGMVLYSQSEFPKVAKVIISDRILKGTIDEKYPITIYLKQKNYSNYHTGTYSVEGWYYYDKVKTKIPLVGIYDGELVLYSFDDATLTNAILNFEASKISHWEEVDYYKGLKNYKEKFLISTSGATWFGENKKLPVSINAKDIQIFKRMEYLMFDKENTFDLHELGNRFWNFSMVAASDKKIILEYEYTSRQYVMGRCGAGVERGFVFLEFNAEDLLITYNTYPIESCLFDFSVSDEIVINDKKIKYVVENYNENKTTAIIIDKEKISIEKE
ncbi:hypothetical protein [Leptobacterium sp. I13]|uniref:hypothetical protein n=1 Tax=Leptobacterium meishanense TaxID=3128904 RepID=UPI0030EF3641